MIRLGAALCLLALCGGSAAAQYEDEETEDYRRQDERYYQRYVDREEASDDATNDAAAFVARADELIRDKNYRSHTGDHYHVQTDDPRLDVRAASALAEGFRDSFERYWSGRTELATGTGTQRVFLFYSYHKYNQLVAGDWSRSLLRPKGHYGGELAAVVIHTDSDRPGGLANTLVHEIAHQLVDQRLYGGRPAAPWIAEGLATYFGDTFMDPEGAFESGVVGGKSVSLLRGEPARARSDAGERLKALRRALKSDDGDSAPFLHIVAADAGGFYNQDVLAHYAMSWLLVHYMLHGDEGRHAAAFTRYLQRDAQGNGGSAALLETVGMTAAELAVAVREHAKQIKVR